MYKSNGGAVMATEFIPFAGEVEIGKTAMELADELESALQFSNAIYALVEAAEMLRAQELKIRELQMRIDSLTVYTNNGSH
jgi:hypothetical protein